MTINEIAHSALTTNLPEAQKRIADLEQQLAAAKEDRDQAWSEMEEQRQKLIKAGCASDDGITPITLDEQVTQVINERDELKGYIKGCTDMIPDERNGVLAGRIANLKADLAAARKALADYGQHHSDCGPFKCTCGFDAALSTQPETTQP